MDVFNVKNKHAVYGLFSHQYVTELNEFCKKRKNLTVTKCKNNTESGIWPGLFVRIFWLFVRKFDFVFWWFFFLCLYLCFFVKQFRFKLF